MKLVEGKDYDFILLTYEEEQKLAQSIMDVLSGYKARYEFYDFLKDIYIWKCYGRDLTSDQLNDLTNYYDMFEIDLPDLIFDGDHIKRPKTKSGRKLSKKAQIEEVRKIITRAWREVWSEHGAFRSSSLEFSRFPNSDTPAADQETYLREQQEIEDAFWAEVEKVKKQWKMTASQVIPAVMDYMPRGDLSAITDGEPDGVLPDDSL